MNDEKEIVLFFKEDYVIEDIDKTCKEIINRFDGIGNYVISMKKDNMILFQENVDMKMSINKNSISMTIRKQYFKNIDEIIFDLVDLFEEENIYFRRIGIIYNLIYSEQTAKSLKHKFFKDTEIIDYNVSLYKKTNIEDLDINVWERYITDSTVSNDLLIQFDFNTPINVVIEFDMYFIKTFINLCEQYIKERIDF